MNILFLNGSPKGDASSTLRYTGFIKENFPEHSYDVLHISRDVKLLKHSRELLKNILSKIKEADGIIIITPVYFHLVPAQFKYFIELLFGLKPAVLKGKYVTVITGSIHYYDDSAHKYLHAVSDDLGMNYISGLSFGPDDMDDDNIRKNLLNFFARTFDIFDIRPFLPREYLPVNNKIHKFSAPPVRISPFTEDKDRSFAGETENRIDKLAPVVVFTDAQPNSNLSGMTDYFISGLQLKVKLININEIGIRSGCRGCGNCLYTGKCIIEDSLSKVLIKEVKQSSGIIFALEIKDRFFSAKFKAFLDRWMVFGLGPFLSGRQMGFIVSGNLRKMPELRYIAESYAESMGANLSGIISDDYENKKQIVQLIDNFVDNFSWSVLNSIKKPMTFVGVAGHKIERDFIYNHTFIYKKNHKEYMDNRLYDFPNRNIRKMVVNAVLSIFLKIPTFNKLGRYLTKKVMAYGISR